MNTTHKIKTLSALILGLGAVGIAHGAGFQLMEQNASGLGNAYAGSAAIAEDASTVFYNPAGMTMLPGMNVAGGAVAIKPSFKFTDGGSTTPTHFGGSPIGPAGNNPTGGPGAGDAGSWAAVPHAYFTWEVNPSLWLGLGVGAPFGLMTDYEKGWEGRYHSERFSIESININPSIAYKVSDTFSIGAGLNWMQLDADYRKAQFVPNLGPLTGGDLQAQVKAKGDAWGWNAGVLWQATPGTRLGLSYRSKVKISADGTTTVSNRSVPDATMGGMGLTTMLGAHNASTTVELPDSAIFSIVHNLNDRWTLLGDISWTGWSSIQSLDIKNSDIPNASLKLKFRDTYRIALGANYRYSDTWTFKGGVAYDQSPVDSDKYRPASLPDNDRYWVSLGAQYNINKNAKIDVGYTHLFLNNTSINNDSDLAGAGRLKGDYKSSADLLGIQFSYRF